MNPSIPIGWEIESHVIPKYNRRRSFDTYAYGRQITGSWEDGSTIRRLVKNPMTAADLDAFLKCPELIPIEWKRKLVFFWGTIYRAERETRIMKKDGNHGSVEYQALYVRCLVWNGKEWTSDNLSLDDEFGPTRVSAEVKRSTSSFANIKSWVYNVFTKR